jgi:AraC-like DNA-binding protein
VKRKSSAVPEQYWRGGKVPLGEEFYHSPSTRAQNYLAYVISIGRSTAPPGHHHGHEHEARFLLHYIHRGQFWYRLRDQTYLARRGTVCFMDLSRPVRYGNDGPGVAEVWWLCFGGKELPAMFADLSADKRPLFENFDSRRFEELFRQLLALTVRKLPGYELRAAGTMALLLAELFATREGDADFDLDLVKLPGAASRLSPNVRDSMRYMARFFDEPTLDLKKLSGVAGLSMYHFVRVFRRETGLSPMHYLNSYRIEKAKRLLATSSEPIRLVARMAGIPNPFKFSHLFRKLTGQTPSRFRARASREKR